MTTGSRPITSQSPTPLRGTQSLVGVMAFVWKHPSLTGLELLWRWLAAVPLLFLAWHTLAQVVTAVPLDATALGSMTFFEPVRSAAVFARQLRLYLPALGQTGKWWIPLALLVWTLAASLGRTAIPRRAVKLSPHPSAPSGSPLLLSALFTLLRALAFLALLASWLLALFAAVRATILSPARQGGDPNLVLLTAEAVGLTVTAFLLWSVTVWALDLKPLETLINTRPAIPAQRAQLRSKLIETNLVMGIVRVALLVLALTFSASPLPFQSHETQAYINVWWIGVALFYVLASNFFHVVRRVTYLRLLQSIATETNGMEAGAS